VISGSNLSANWEQIVSELVPDNRMPNSVVSWLPFYHDMGLMMGLFAGILGGWQSAGISAGPNFAFELTAARTSDVDMIGLDLGDVSYIMSGAERVNPTIISRFTQRFAGFNLPESVIRPAYGLAEATLFVATTHRVGRTISSISSPKNCRLATRSDAGPARRDSCCYHRR